MPPVRRDIHNAILPIDFSDIDDVFTVVETINNFIQRKIPLRWGLVPRTHTEGAEAQGKVVYHLLDTYGLSTVMKYLQSVSYGPLAKRRSINTAIVIQFKKGRLP
jgi:UDP-glucose:glycoprotein glucosyltransferase